MKENRLDAKGIALRSLLLLTALLFVFAAAAQALSYRFSFNLSNQVTSGRNWHSYAAASTKVTAYGNTYNPWDGNEQFKVSLDGLGASRSVPNYFVADGATRTQYISLPSAGDRYPVVWLRRNIAGSGTRVEGAGTTSQ